MTPEQLDQIQARADAATGGVWKAWDRGIGYEVHGPDDEPLNFNFRETFTKSDATFIAHARTDVPALLALVREQRARIGRVEALADKWERTPALRRGTSAADIRAALTATEEPADSHHVRCNAHTDHEGACSWPVFAALTATEGA